MELIFETARLSVRRYTKDDYDNMYLMHGDPKVMQYIRAVKTRAESDAMLDEVLAADNTSFLGRWAVNEKATQSFIGTFVIVPIPTEPTRIQLGYSFRPEKWGQGFATEVTLAGLQYFRDKTPLSEIYAVIETANIASRRVLEKAGFTFFETKMEGEKELTIFIIRR